MKNLHRISTYFNSIYSNSSRHNSNILSLLGLIFERNNKIRSTMTQLGTTFKSSKWSDFKSQNIKESLIKDWLILLVMCIVLLVCIFIIYSLLASFFTGYNDIGIWISYTTYKPVQLILTILLPCIDYFNYLTVCLGSYYLHLAITTRLGLGGNQKDVLDTIVLGIKDESVNENTTNQSVNTTSQYTNDCVASLETTNNQVNTLILNPEHVTFNEGTNQAITLIKDFRTKVWFITINDSLVESKSNNINPTQLDYVPKLSNKALQISLDPYSLSNLQKNVQFIPSNLNVINQLSLAKEDRWFFKNSLLADSLAKTSNNFTQSKKLFNTGLYAVKTHNNVWLSSKFNGHHLAEANKMLSLLNNSTGSINHVLESLSSQGDNTSSLNFFEDSRFFFTKRYFFTNQLKNNAWESQNKKSPIIESLSNDLPIFNYNRSNYRTSITHNLDNLIAFQNLEFKLISQDIESINDIDLNLGMNSTLCLNNTVSMNSLLISSSLDNRKDWSLGTNIM